MSLLLLVFSLHIHSLEGSCIYEENTSDSRDIPWCATRKHCLTSIYHLFTEKNKRLHFFFFTGNTHPVYLRFILSNFLTLFFVVVVFTNTAVCTAYLVFDKCHK